MSDKDDVVFGSWTGDVKAVWDSVEITNGEQTGTAIYLPQVAADVDFAPIIGMKFVRSQEGQPFGSGYLSMFTVYAEIKDDPQPYMRYKVIGFANPAGSNMQIVTGGNSFFANSFDLTLMDPDLKSLSGKRIFVQANVPVKGTLIVTYPANINRG